VLAAHDAETLGQLAFRDLPVPQPEDHQTEDHRNGDQFDNHRTRTEEHEMEAHQPEEDYQA
jgi:hypothetical protein